MLTSPALRPTLPRPPSCSGVAFNPGTSVAPREHCFLLALEGGWAGSGLHHPTEQGTGMEGLAGSLVPSADIHHRSHHRHHSHAQLPKTTRHTEPG